MDILFEKKYRQTDQMLSEYVHKVICRKLKWSGTILTLVSLVFLLFTLYRGDNAMSMLFGICGAIMLFVVLFAPPLTIRQIQESSRRIHNGNHYETVVSFGDNISIEEGTFSLTVEYSQIQSIHSLKYSYVLMFGKNNGIMVSPEAFTKGSFDDFVRYIHSKVSITKN
jgi:hypothetical protein